MSSQSKDRQADRYMLIEFKNWIGQICKWKMYNIGLDLNSLS